MNAKATAAPLGFGGVVGEPIDGRCQTPSAAPAGVAPPDNLRFEESIPLRNQPVFVNDVPGAQARRDVAARDHHDFGEIVVVRVDANARAGERKAMRHAPFEVEDRPEIAVRPGTRWPRLSA